VRAAGSPGTSVSQMRTVSSKLPLKSRRWRSLKSKQQIEPGHQGTEAVSARMQSKRTHDSEERYTPANVPVERANHCELRASAPHA